MSCMFPCSPQGGKIPQFNHTYRQNYTRWDYEVKRVPEILPPSYTEPRVGPSGVWLKSHCTILCTNIS